MLLDLGAISMANGLLHYLNTVDSQTIDFGLSAAFLICRVVGRDESGAGMELIQNNALLLKNLRGILANVLAAGPGGIVLGSQ